MGEAQREILTETFRLLGARVPLLSALAGFALLALGAEAVLRRSRARGPVRGVLVAAAIGSGMWLAWGVLWLADDAFISFRYARNFARGNGLVFNAGEWVEGYTNFLWTAVLGVAGRVGIDIPYAGLFASLLCFVLALFTTSVVVRHAAGRVAIPFSALVLAGLAPFFTFASSGLETMALALLGAAAMSASTKRRGALLAGIACVLAALTRPDVLLVYGCMGLALLAEDLVFREGPVRRRVDLPRMASFVAPLLLIYVPYFLFRWHAYGDFLPNTFYVKSGGLSYFRQGFLYLFHFLATTGGWAWLPLFVVAVIGRPRARDEWRLRVFAFLSLLIYGAYVVKVGGDFMEHRFFVPLLPLAAVATEVGLRARLRSSRTVAGELACAGLAAVAIAAALVPVRLIGPYEKRWFMAAEHTYYPVTSLAPLRVGSGYMEAGLKLHSLFAEKGVRPKIVGDAIGMLGYYSDLPLVDAFGLTNRRIAHKPVHGRGRPGHEKFGTPEELQAEGAELSLWPLWGDEWKEQTKVRVGDTDLYLTRLDDGIAAMLSKVGARPPNPLVQVAVLSREGARDDVLAAVPFYRSFLVGRADRDALVSMLEVRLNSVADFEEDELPPGTRTSGYGMWVARGLPPRGSSGRGWLSSFGEGRSRVEIPIERIIGKELRFVLGGMASTDLKVSLMSGGLTFREASPSGADTLLPVSWDVTELKGRSAVLVIEDDDPSPEVGLVVDGIHFAPNRGDIRTRIARWRQGGGGDFAALLREAERILPAGDPDRDALLDGLEERWTLDELPPGTTITGEAFGAGPVRGPIYNQQPIFGWQGAGLIDSFHFGDRAVGKIQFPERVLSGGPISLLIGGGANCRETFVGLEVQGKVVGRVCGKEDEVLRPAVLPTKKWAGQKGRLVIVDRSSGPWGHILVDDVLFIRPESGAIRSAADR